MLEFLLLVILLLLWNMADFFYNMIFNIGENFTVEKILGLTSEKVDFSSFNAFFNSLGYKFSQSPLSSAFVVLLTIAVFILFASAIFAVLKGMATTNEETKKKYHPYTVLTTTLAFYLGLERFRKDYPDVDLYKIKLIKIKK